MMERLYCEDSNGGESKVHFKYCKNDENCLKCLSLKDDNVQAWFQATNLYYRPHKVSYVGA